MGFLSLCVTVLLSCIRNRVEIHTLVGSLYPLCTRMLAHSSIGCDSLSVILTGTYMLMSQQYKFLVCTYSFQFSSHTLAFSLDFVRHDTRVLSLYATAVLTLTFSPSFRVLGSMRRLNRIDRKGGATTVCAHTNHTFPSITRIRNKIDTNLYTSIYSK